MAESRVPAVIAALLALTAARTGYRLPAAVGQGIGLTTVWDGPEWSESDDYAAGGHMIVGWGGSGTSVTPGATSSWDGGPIAGVVHPRRELITVEMMMISQSQDTPLLARTAAYAGLSDVSAICRADVSLALNTADTIGGVRTVAFVTAGQLTQYNRRGYVAELQFTVTIEARV